MFKKRTAYMFCTLSLLAGALYYVNTAPSQQAVTLDDSDWHTFEMDDKLQISKHPTTKKEAQEANIELKKESRSPASVPAPKKRELFKHPGQHIPKDLTYSNKVSANWKEKMAPTIMRFLTPQTKLFVKPLESLAIIEKGQGRYVEKVLVKFLTQTGRHYSYNALVDSETGHIVKTWNRIQHEGHGHKAVKLNPVIDH